MYRCGDTSYVLSSLLVSGVAHQCANLHVILWKAGPWRNEHFVTIGNDLFPISGLKIQKLHCQILRV